MTDGEVDADMSVAIQIDGEARRVAASISVAAALHNMGKRGMRISVTGEARAPLCGMGVCYECRATVDGVEHRRTCLMSVADGMVIETGMDGDR